MLQEAPATRCAATGSPHPLPMDAGAAHLAVTFVFASKNQSILSSEPSHDAVTVKNRSDRMRVIGHRCPEMDRPQIVQLRFKPAHHTNCPSHIKRGFGM